SFTYSAFTWSLSGPAGLIVNARQFWNSDAADGNPLLDLPAGDYTIMVDTSTATTGNFSFRLLDATTASPFTPGTLVSGALAPGNSTALYRFTASAGDAFYFDGRPTSGFTGNPYVQIYSPLGNPLLPSQSITSDKDTFTLPQTGTYIFTVEGRAIDTSASGNYSFLLARNSPQPPTPLFDTNVAPDLIVMGLAVNPSSGLQSGDSATVQWTTRNNGNATTVGSFTERVTVRNTGTGQIIANRTLLYDESISGGINPGETRPRQLAITLPNGPSGAGTLEVTVTSDIFNQIAEQNLAGTAEANNAVTINITSVLAPYPDLQVLGLAVSPPAGWPTGSVVTVSWITTNTGTRATSGSWTESLVVRNTNTAQIIVNTGTNYDATSVGDIAPNGSRNRSLSFTMPLNANAYGAFEIVVTTDNDNNVFEYNSGGTAENNNSASILSTSAPDLQVSGLTVTGNPSLQAGSQLVIQWNTANQGNVQADGSFYDRVTVRNTNTAELLFSTDLPYNPASGGNGPIPPGGSRARQQTFQLPEGARAVGRLEVSVTTDIYGSLAEFNEGNNGSQAQVTVAARPYPDLVVTNITSPASGRPGQTVPVIWTIRNVGTVPATGSWSDHLFLSADTSIGADQFLSALSFSGTLNAGQSITRTQQVTLPNFGTGNRYFVVETDAGSQMFEDNEGNNAAIATQPTVLPATLILSLSPNTVLESAGVHASLGTITRNSDVASALSVTLLNDLPSKIVVPSGLTIPIGSASTNFFIEVLNDAIAESNVVATIIAQAASHMSGTNTLTITEDDRPALTLRLSAASVSESAFSGAVTGTIRRNANTNQPLTVNLTSDRPSALTVPPTVTIPAGETNVTFNLTPVGDDVVTGDRVVQILAAASGFSSVSAPITVLDDDTVSLSLQLSDNSVPENVVNPAATAVVTRSPVNSGSLRIRIQGANASVLQLPAEVTIPPNQSAVTFNVNVRDDNLAFGSHGATINADALALDGTAIPGAHASAPFLVVDNDGPTLSLSINAAVIAEGASTSATVTRNTPATNSLTVNLSAAPSGQISLPSSVVIPNGAASVNFTINGLNDATSDGAQEVDVTASASGFNPGSAPVTVTDIDIPDLVALSVTGPTNALTDGLISAVWSVTNSGLATATGTWIDEVYVATDAQGASATLVAVVTNTGPLVVGDTYTHSRSFLLPSDPGSYWILVRADAHNDLTEGSERNNVLLSAPIDVQPAYRATVSTTVDSAISGTPIPLSGRTFFSSNNSAAPFRTATVRINVNRVRRTLDVLSDSQGYFSTVFQPIPGEAGAYTVGADHPRVRQDPIQDQFTLLGMSALPWELNVRLAPNIATNGEIEIRNLSPLPLTGLIADQEGLPLDFAATTTVTNVLAGNATVLLSFSISTTLNTPASGRFFLRVTSGEGAILRIPVNFVVAPPTAQLTATPALLQRGMLRGAQTLVSFDVSNQGGVASGDLTVALPVLPWLSLVSTSTIPSLAPGARSTVVLALNPATNLALVRYDGSVAIIGQQTSLGVPFQFRALSDARGDLHLTVTDEHTYYVNGSPHPTNATVVLRDIVTNGIVAQASTDANGEIRFSNLLEGDYQLEALAPSHGSVHGSIRVVPGTTTEQEVFMTLQTVRYEWHVVPTQVEDHYRVVIEPKFETEVPQPNLVVENPLVIPLVIAGQTTQFEIRLRNTGLVALQRVRVPVPSHPSLIITPLVTELEVLPAQTSVAIPVTIREAPPSGGGIMSAGAPCDNCVVQMPVSAGFPCGGIFVPVSAPAVIAPVCLANTGCNFDHVDVTRVDFMTANSISDRAAFDCIAGHMNECQKARVRGYIASGQFGSLLSPELGFGLSGFCACGPPASIPNLLAAATAFMNVLGFSVTTAPSAPGVSVVTPTVPGPCSPPPPSPGGGVASLSIPPSNGATGVCAKVRLDLTQDVMLTRNAFRGTLVLDNVGQGDLTGIQVIIDIRDAANQSANSLFGFRDPTLAGLNAVDGSGVLGPGGTGSAEYLFIPTLDAAPTEPTAYLIGGTLRFIEDGQEVVVPLLKAPITVLPEARLQLEYFQQRDVYSDDPFTPELEPAEPFALGLRINNVGAGIARNFRIASAQPKIIENEKGLVVDFRLIGARIDNQPVTPTFNLDFGNINPDSSKIVVWDMTSSLQGKFIDYRASFEHVDDLGVRNLSLIESVNIHELIHVVRADRAFDDTLPDFLVNDSPDPNSLPDIVYLSQGSNAPVSIASNPAFTGSITPSNLQVQLTATMPAGWTYLRVTNPGPDFRLVSVRRSDNKLLRMGDNAWTTDRTFPSSQTGAIHEQLLHLFDLNSSGNYTLTFASIAQDTNAPSSAVVALPSTSPASFPVEWSGDDGTGSGVAFFDVYVSVNGGPFTNWLAHTALHSAIFDGQNGNTYAFYSRATDADGNQEIAPASADTQTTTSGVNTAPTINPIANSTINEGSLLNVLATALDTDTPRQTLTFSLIFPPAGATINGASGQIRWQTSEAHGGTTNVFTLVVAD
ncbi:MAG TPA: CARDB domain-containing protein, partial [Verrucomicrobiae bacterium]|nr:CARDB domain-containing protein [Verrucomicrobiae bacterium]